MRTYLEKQKESQIKIELIAYLLFPKRKHSLIIICVGLAISQVWFTQKPRHYVLFPINPIKILPFL